MLMFFIIFLAIGFFLGFLDDDDTVFGIILLITIAWAFIYGWWAIATFFELIMGMTIAHSLLGKELEEKGRG